MWTYNILVQVSSMTVETTQQEKRLVHQCLKYSGAQVLHHFTDATKQQITEMLQQLQITNTVNDINIGNILFQGAKTIERIRGNVQLATWVSNSGPKR